jgi:putative phage-type endonuclease
MSAPIRTEDVTAFHRAAEWTGVRDREREAWHALRRTMVTASDFAALLGEDPYRDALTVYAEKVMDKPPEALDIADPRFWGTKLEQTVLATAAEFYGWDYRAGGCLLRSRRYPFIGATLDAEVDRHDGRGWLAFECKNTEIHRNWDEETQECPRHVLVQCQAQLLVTEAPMDLCFALLSRYRPVRIEVEPVIDFHAVLLEVAEEFLDRVRRIDPPPATARSEQGLRLLFPREDGSRVTLPAEAVEWTRELKRVAVELESLKNRKEELRNLLKQSIGSATFGILPEVVDDRRAWRWITTTRAEHTVESSTSRTLKLLKHPTMPGEKHRATSLPRPIVRSVSANDSQVDEIIRFRGRRRARR